MKLVSNNKYVVEYFDLAEGLGLKIRSELIDGVVCISALSGKISHANDQIGFSYSKMDDISFYDKMPDSKYDLETQHIIYCDLNLERLKKVAMSHYYLNNSE